MWDTLLAPLLTEATVDAVGADGTVALRLDSGDTLSARVVYTHDGPPAALDAGARVLVARAGDALAYVLGRLTPPPAAREAGRHVTVVMPDGVETVRLAGRRVTVAADEELTLTCGGSSVRLDARGKVVVLGTDITSRARRQHKIKGASVAIN